MARSDVFRSMASRLLAALAVVALAVIPAPAQELAARQPVAKVAISALPASRLLAGDHPWQHELNLKLVDTARARLDEAGRLISRSGADLSEVSAVVQRHGLSLAPLIAISEERLAALEARAAARSGRAQPDLAGMFRIEFPGADSATLEQVGREFQALAAVEFAYLATHGAPPPADIAPTTPDLEYRQGYLDGGAGMDVDFAWSIGITGDGVRISDCEYGWNLNHEDLVDIGAVKEPGQTINPQVWVNGWGHHGTAVLGEMVAGDNGYGATGAAHGSDVFLYPEWTLEGGFRRVTAITNAIADSDAGDVVLLEMQTGAGAPAEVDPNVWTVSRVGSDAGVIVVGAAGNGNEDLDGAGYSAYQSLGDSGAIIVGAGSATIAHNKLSFSTFGTRVNVQGWGTSVFTLGYGSYAEYGGDNNQKYTSTFSGTSSASPNVAAAAALLQEFAFDDTGNPLTPADLRQLLIDTGEAQGTGGHIGPFPNLRAAMGGESAWEDIGFAFSGPFSDLVLDGTGSLTDGSSGSLELKGATGNTTALMFVSLESNPQAFMGGQLVPLPILISVLLVTSSSGEIDLLFVWPGGLPSGSELYVQYALDDVFAPFGVGLSNAVRGTVP